MLIGRLSGWLNHCGGFCVADRTLGKWIIGPYGSYWVVDKPPRQWTSNPFGDFYENILANKPSKKWIPTLKTK